MWQIIDILERCLKAALFLYLCGNMIEIKKKYKKQGKYIFFLLLVVWGIWLSNSKWLQALLYGETMGMESSRTILKLFLMILVYYCLTDFFYEGSRLVKAYLVVLYETIYEMAMFGIHGIWSLGTNAYFSWWTECLIEEAVPLENFDYIMKVSEYIWNLSLLLPPIFIAYLTIRIIRKELQEYMSDINRQGIWFLLISSLVGLVFDLALRCILYTRTGMQIDLLYDRHKGMYAVVPVMTFLCLLSIICSIKIYGELIRAQEEKNRLLFYKQQLSDMTGHVQEMERLYDGIRGMRHDMNNYIADMEQLIRAEIKQGNLEASVELEAQKYLYHMKDAMDTLTIRYSTGNPVMDVIMNRKWQECEKEEICLISDFFYPEQLGIEAFDLGILMNNALDNAIEACRKCNGNKKGTIQVHSYQKDRMFFLRIENDCNGADILYAEERILKTTKEDAWMHGIGLKNMKSIVEKYFGTMSYEIKDDVFYLTIMLQGRVKTDSNS